MGQASCVYAKSLISAGEILEAMRQEHDDRLQKERQMSSLHPQPATRAEKWTEPERTLKFGGLETT